MGCGSSKPAIADSAAPESQQQHTSSSDANAPASKHTSQKLQPIPTSSLRPVEFGLVKGLEYGEKTAPALLVVQEWWGINEDIKEKALLLHQKGGCRVFIPDLYEGKVTVEVAEAKHMYDSLDWPAAAERLVQAAEYLLNTGSPKVAAIGFCMGGALAVAASQYRKICAAVACYGLPPADLCVPHKVDSPVQIHVGTKDDYLPAGLVSQVAQAEEFAAGMKAAGGFVELHVYEGVGHAFLNKPDMISQPTASDKDISQAWERIQKFLKLHLVPTSPGVVTDPAMETRAGQMNEGSTTQTAQ